jgi:hypothetical protein
MPRRSVHPHCSCHSRRPESLSLLIVEAGASIPPGFAPRPGEFVVLFQQNGESPRAFSQRVVAHHRELTQAGTRLERAFLAVGSERSEDTLAARYRIARHLIAGSESSGTRELAFLAPANHAARHELRALAGALQEGLFGSDFNVNVDVTNRSLERAPREAA